jgi:hypothetical protein
MDDPTTSRRRRRQSDQYADDVLRDGEFLRVPMTLADSAMRDVVHQKYPPRGYRRGYTFDQISDPVTRGGWPTQVSGIVPMYNHAVGDPCRCRSGESGTLQPHPTIQSALICVANSKDGLAPNDQAYSRRLQTQQSNQTITSPITSPVLRPRIQPMRGRPRSTRSGIRMRPIISTISMTSSWRCTRETFPP